MNNLEAWAPYLNNPSTLAAFIAVLASGVLLGVLKWKSISGSVITVVITVFVVCVCVALLLAVSREFRTPAEAPAVTSAPQKNQAEPVKPEVPTSINVQIAHGSNNVITNGSEKGK